MSTQLSKAQEALFGREGIGATNVKLFPGTDRNATPEQIAAEINASLERIADGQVEEIQLY